MMVLARIAGLLVLALLASQSAVSAPPRPNAPRFANDVLIVNHVAPYQCGVKQGSFARICRANAYPTCLRAVKRGVKGFSNAFCAARRAACHSCLGELRTCIGKIGHAKRVDFSCGECTGKFSRCIGRRYPKAKGD